jgi:putative methyltransferase (TIGR04325 family)
MGVIDTCERIARNLWRVPGLGQLMAFDYGQSFRHRPPNRFRGVFASFAEAAASLPSGERVGYDHDIMAGMYRARMDRACESDYGPLFWLRGIIDANTRMFDFGGHVGVSYYGWRSYLNYPSGMRWMVYEVPAIARAGAELARERQIDGLHFTSDLADGRDCNVFMAAGSLQYVDMSVPQILERIGTYPPHVIVSKVPLYDGDTFVTVQSTGRAFHPYKIENKEQFVAGMQSCGYRVVDEWQNREQHCEIPFTKGRNVEAYSGFYFARN